MNNPQGTLHLQMLHQTRSKNEEEIEDGDRHEDVQEQQQEEETPNCGPLNGKMIDTHVEKSCKKSGYLMSSSKLASKQPAVDHARHGKIVKVHGGHIARKDRHSKVHTSKGPRDRRFRLSAPTAIQFYDVQDRLGCHRPSKAIDWLIEKAKSAIEALSDELPSKEQDIGEQSMHHQGSNGGQETMSNVNPMNNMNRFKEPVFDPLQLCPVNYAEEAFNSASSLSDSKVMEMGWFQSLMGWNYNSAGDGGDSGEAYPFNSSSLHLH